MPIRAVPLVLLTLTGCVGAETAKELRAEITSLRGELATTQASLETTSSLADSLRRALRLERLLEGMGTSVSLDPAQEGYGILESQYGPLTFSIAGVEPLADGSRVTIEIGNLSSATINGGVLGGQWGPRMGDDEQFSAWSEKIREGDLRFSADLAPGTWNRVPVTLAGVPPSEFGHLRLQLKEFPRITLSTAR